MNRVEKHWTGCCEALSCVVAVFELASVSCINSQLGLSCTMLPAFTASLSSDDLLCKCQSKSVVSLFAQFTSGAKPSRCSNHLSDHSCNSVSARQIQLDLDFLHISHWVCAHKPISVITSNKKNDHHDFSSSILRKISSQSAACSLAVGE